MTQVADAAGVSVSTVSHVINGTRPVAPATRARVERLIRELGFTHQPAARSLAAGSTRTIGLAMSAHHNPFWNELVEGLESEAARHRLQIHMVDTGDDPETEQKVVASLLAHHVAGLILVPSVGWESTTLRLLTDRPAPYVLLDRFHSEVPVDQVGVENTAASQTVVGHLFNLGHRRVAMIQGLPGVSTTSERVAGYERAHVRHGVPVDPALSVPGDSTDEGGYRAMRQLLTLTDRPTAFYGGNLSMTLGALRALRETGLRVPDDMAVVTFDDTPWMDLFEPNLTAVAQPSFAIGARAIQMLARRLDDGPSPAQTLRLGAEIVHRTSCGCARETSRDTTLRTT